jgi:trehalose 6-phosphate phosphatase
MADADHAPPLALLDGAALFLDFDGTLVELAETPDSIRVPGALRPLVERLARKLGGRLAIVSGRAIADLDLYVGTAGISVAGSHGLELRAADGRTSRPPPVAALEEARAEIAAFAAGREGLLVEEKPASVALHYRRAPALEGEVMAFMAKLADRSGLAVQAGKMVAELRPPGANKGDAVLALMAEPAFVGARPVVVGDDITDEDAFEAAVRLGGAGVLVGPTRPTAARWRLDDVAAVSRWLREAAAQ